MRRMESRGEERNQIVQGIKRKSERARERERKRTPNRREQEGARSRDKGWEKM